MISHTRARMHTHVNTHTTQTHTHTCIHTHTYSRTYMQTYSPVNPTSLWLLPITLLFLLLPILLLFAYFQFYYSLFTSNPTNLFLLLFFASSNHITLCLLLIPLPAYNTRICDSPTASSAEFRPSFMQGVRSEGEVIVCLIHLW